MVEKYGLSASESTVHELLKTRSKDFSVGLMTDKRMFQTAIPLWKTEGTKIIREEDGILRCEWEEK